MLCVLSLLFFAVGASIAIMLSNFFLIPVMAIGCMFLPFWWVKLTAGHFKKDIAAELETALSIITTAYLRNEDILDGGGGKSPIPEPACAVRIQGICIPY